MFGVAASGHSGQGADPPTHTQRVASEVSSQTPQTTTPAANVGGGGVGALEEGLPVVVLLRLLPAREPAFDPPAASFFKERRLPALEALTTDFGMAGWRGAWMPPSGGLGPTDARAQTSLQTCRNGNAGCCDRPGRSVLCRAPTEAAQVGATPGVHTPQPCAQRLALLGAWKNPIPRTAQTTAIAPPPPPAPARLRPFARPPSVPAPSRPHRSAADPLPPGPPDRPPGAPVSPARPAGLPLPPGSPPARHASLPGARLPAEARPPILRRNPLPVTRRPNQQRARMSACTGRRPITRTHTDVRIYARIGICVRDRYFCYTPPGAYYASWYCFWYCFRYFWTKTAKKYQNKYQK